MPCLDAAFFSAESAAASSTASAASAFSPSASDSSLKLESTLRISDFRQALSASSASSASASAAARQAASAAIFASTHAGEMPPPAAISTLQIRLHSSASAAARRAASAAISEHSASRCAAMLEHTSARAHATFFARAITSPAQKHAPA